MEIVFKRIIIFSGDVNKLKMFYQEHFELKLVEEIKDEWVVLNAGNTEIAFHRIGAAYRNDDISFRAESNTKLVFKINNDLATFREELLIKGVLLKELKSFTGFDYILCDGEDPEGNIFQLMQKINP